MSKSDRDLVALARKRLGEAEDADKLNRERGQDDLRFAVGEQWDEGDKRQREIEGRPCLVINNLAQFVRQVTGQIRQTNPAIKITAADSAASDDVAEILEGLIRQIQHQSDASSVFEGAAESAAACGIGHFRVRSDYCGPYTFDQELLIERIPNPFAVFWDPSAVHPTRKDAGYCFIAEDMPVEEFKAAYPDVPLNEITDAHRDSSLARWYAGETVTVAEYYWIEHEDRTIYLLPNGEVVDRLPEGVQAIRKRKAKVPRVRWAKITGTEVLEGPIDVPGRFIPVFAVTGEEWHLGAEKYRSGVIRFAKDPQRLYNYARSTGAEMTAIQPKAPYLVTPRQVQGYETFWENANRTNSPYLPYNPDERAPPPQRVPPPIPSAAIQQEIMLAAEDMKRTTGIYDASLGARSNETSGVAIRQRQMESQLGTSIYADNMAKAILQCGQVLIEQIPAIYDTQRVIRILGENDQEKQVAINQVLIEMGQAVIRNDVTIGKYEARVSIGPTYESRRQEAAQGMLDFVERYPPGAQAIADILAELQDWPQADRVAKRLRKTMPPGIVDMDDLSPEEQQEAMQAQQQGAQMQAAAQELEMREKAAKVEKTEAEAQKIVAETVAKQFELAMASGQMDAAVNAAVSRVIAGMMAQQAPQPGGMPF